MLLSRQHKVAWDSQTNVSEPDDAQTSKVWTIQIMTLILTPALITKSYTDSLSSRVLIHAQ